jgi:hypothetical protein
MRHYHVSVLDVLCFPATLTRNHLPFSPDLFQFCVRLHKLSLESNVEKKCTTGTEESITDTGKNEKDSGSKSVERIEHPSQNHGNDTRFLEPLLEKTQPCKGKEFEMSTSIELNVDKICTACEDEHKICSMRSTDLDPESFSFLPVSVIDSSVPVVHFFSTFDSND